ELKKAVALGDLSENAEYLSARQRQDYVKARLGQLSKRLSEISLLNYNNIPRDRVAFGSTVVVYDVEKGKEMEYLIVTSEESDVSQGKISSSSPIGRSLMGKQVGDTVTAQTPSGRKEFEILKLTTIHDAAEGA
ncbi:MAG: transcription elongation factor GreA, partial [Acidobacteria bacterium]|nr:transcription elongation factor GreA [Acidobacteriota bacterium]